MSTKRHRGRERARSAEVYSLRRLPSCVYKRRLELKPVPDTVATVKLERRPDVESAISSASEPQGRGVGTSACRQSSSASRTTYAIPSSTTHRRRQASLMRLGVILPRRQRDEGGEGSRLPPRPRPNSAGWIASWGHRPCGPGRSRSGGNTVWVLEATTALTWVQRTSHVASRFS